MEVKSTEKQRLEIMVDIETASLKENAAWIEVSAVPFRLNGEKVNTLPSYTQIVDMMSCYMAGMDMNGCQDFWSKQDPKVIVHLVNGKKLPIATVANQLYEYFAAFQERYEVEIWAQGIDFDCPKLEWVFRKFVEKDPPYSYWNKSDARTFCNKMGIKKEDFEFVGVKHSSMDDCHHQIKKVNAAYDKLRPAASGSESQEEKR